MPSREQTPGRKTAMPGRRNGRPPDPRGPAIAILLASALSAGAVRTHDAPIRKAARGGAERIASNLGTSECTREVLARHGLLGAALIDPEAAALRLERALTCCPGCEPGATLALAELW